MENQTIQFVRGLVLIPFLTIGSPFAMLQDFRASFNAEAVQETQAVPVSPTKERAEKIDAYFAKRNMPLEGFGAKMIAEAEEHDLDWRLLPAIAIKESTGGKFACYNNPFGWGSCKIKFKTFEQAIETVALNLGGENPATEQYYKGKTTVEKLHHYNNSVVPTYTSEILEFMALIEAGV